MSGGYTVFYDDACAFCVRCHRWLRAQAALVPLSFVPMRVGKANPKLFGLWATESAVDELVVLGPHGEVYQGPNAFIVCLWALDAYRELSFRLATPGLLPFARAAFRQLSKRRQDLAYWLNARDQDLAAHLTGQESESCDGPECRS